jgi:hypothetical protein
MSLALVIPVRNDPVQLSRLLDQADTFGMFDQIIVVDDCSDVPVSCSQDVTLVRLDQAGGAGAARNRGLLDVETTHLIFFDSDDLFTPEMPLLWHDLQGQDFDVCIFRHNDSRVSELGGWGQPPLDNAFWLQAGGLGALFEVTGPALGLLAQTANYPWNKIYRTDFARDAGLQCSQTQVHNDIALHWHSFAAAKRCLGSNRIAAQHFVNSQPDRLTNEAGRARLAIFKALYEAAQTLPRGGGNMLWPAFIHFSTGLLDWVRSILDADIHPELDRRVGVFWADLLDQETYSKICTNDPVLGLRLALQMAGGRTLC